MCNWTQTFFYQCIAELEHTCDGVRVVDGVCGRLVVSDRTNILHHLELLHNAFAIMAFPIVFKTSACSRELVIACAAEGVGLFQVGLLDIFT